MAYIAAAICFASGVGGAVYLVMSGHPWFALLLLAMAGTISFKESDKSNG